MHFTQCRVIYTSEWSLKRKLTLKLKLQPQFNVRKKTLLSGNWIRFVGLENPSALIFWLTRINGSILNSINYDLPSRAIEGKVFYESEWEIRKKNVKNRLFIFFQGQRQPEKFGKNSQPFSGSFRSCEKIAMTIFILDPEKIQIFFTKNRILSFPRDLYANNWQISLSIHKFRTSHIRKNRKIWNFHNFDIFFFVWSNF